MRSRPSPRAARSRPLSLSSSSVDGAHKCFGDERATMAQCAAMSRPRQNYILAERSLVELGGHSHETLGAGLLFADKSPRIERRLKRVDVGRRGSTSCPDCAIVDTTQAT